MTLSIDRSRVPGPRPQRGAALAVGLFFLVILSLALVVSFRASILQERMAGGLRNVSLASQGAETALRSGENWFWDWVVRNGRRPMGPGETAFVRLPAPIEDTGAVNDFRTDPEWIADGEPYGDAAVATTPGAELAQEPLYIIETIAGGSADDHVVSHTGSAYGGGSRGALVYRRITGRSTGGVEEVVRAVESTFTVVQ